LMTAICIRPARMNGNAKKHACKMRMNIIRKVLARKAKV
jgi:hypothetical protein